MDTDANGLRHGVRGLLRKQHISNRPPLTAEFVCGNPHSDLYAYTYIHACMHTYVYAYIWSSGTSTLTSTSVCALDDVCWTLSTFTRADSFTPAAAAMPFLSLFFLASVKCSFCIARVMRMQTHVGHT